MNSIEQFFLMCSGAHGSILKKSPTDVNKYIGIGATIFFTGLLAMISASYAIYTVFDHWVGALCFGLVWGLMIFNLDRYIVSSMKRRGSFASDFFTALPRLILAVIISIVISKPLELKIFEKEINAEIVSMEQEVFKTQESKVQDRYQVQVQSLQADIASLKNEIQQKQTRRDELTSIAQQEADGTGGSKQKNLGPIYKTKKQDADQADGELKALTAQYQPLISDKESQVKMIQASMQEDIKGLNKTALGGFASRIDALSRLAAHSQAIWIASLFIMLLFIAIETAPIFVKLISARSPYDYVLHNHEHVFEMNHQKVTSVLQASTLNHIAEVNEVSTYKTQAKIKAEKQLIEHAVREEVERLKQEPMGWKQWWANGGFMRA